MTVVDGTPAGYIIDTTNGLITFTRTNAFLNTYYNYPTLLASGVIP
jgi:hypothetical protein